MAITFIQKKKNQKYLVLIFGALIAVIAFVFLSGYFEEEIGEEVLISEPVITTKHLPSIKIDFDVLGDPVFKKLTEEFPALPSAPALGDLGRENPFLPYEEASLPE